MAAPAPAWLPTPDDVAALIPQRTIDATGEAQGLFTPTTMPTYAQVAKVIALIANDMLTATGTVPVVPVDLTGTAATVCAQGAAAKVELGFYDGDPHTYTELDAAYVDALAGLVHAVGQVVYDGTVSPLEGMPLPAWEYGQFDLGSYTQPIPITTWGTRF